MIFNGRNRVRYNYSRWGYTRGNGSTWHGGLDIEGLDDKTILMPSYDGRTISGTVVKARIVEDHSNPTWEWGWYVCVQLDDNQTPDIVNFLYFCHCESVLVRVGQKVKTGDRLAIMGNTGNAALASPPFAHCHLEVRQTATSKGLDPTHYAEIPNSVGTYGESKEDALEYTEYTGMSYLVPGEYSGTYEYFYSTDVNTSAGSLIKNGSYRLLGISKTQKGGYTWAKIKINSSTYYVALHDKYEAVNGPVFPSIIYEGIDISKWQGKCNYSAISAAGYKFVIIRVLGKNGNENYIDEYFEQNYLKAKEAGLQVGIYFYTKATTKEMIKQEIDFFLPHLKNKQFELPIYIDIEESKIYSTMDKYVNTEIVRAGAEYLIEKGFYPGWYTYRTFATNYLIPESLTKYTFWIAETGSSMPKYQGPYEMWQYTQINGAGLVESSALDVDKLYFDMKPYITKSQLNGWVDVPDYSETTEFTMQVQWSDNVITDHGNLKFYLYNGFDIIGSTDCNFANGYRGSFGYYRIYGDDGLKRSYYITDSAGKSDNLPIVENYDRGEIHRNAPEFSVMYTFSGDAEKPSIEEISKARFILTGGTTQEWERYNPILKKNELVLDTTKRKFKVGDGTNHYSDLDNFGTDASSLEGHSVSDFALSNQIPKKVSDLEQDVQYTFTKEDIGLPNVTNDRQVVGITSDITPGNILILGEDGYHVEDSGIPIAALKKLLGL